jgi:hypothetical protein
LKSPIQFGLLLALLMLLAGCGLFAASEEPSAPVAIRTGHPTFTPTVPPTPVPPQAGAPAAAQDQSTPQPTAPVSGSAKAVINGPLVNARSGPGIEHSIIAEVERGEEFDIVGVSPDGAWWQVCCVEGAQAWVTSEFVDTLGLVDSVPVVGGAAEAQASQAPAAADASPTATPQPAAPAVNFDLETQEQFPESALVRIFLYVYADNSALEGYSIRVTKDGTALPVAATSFGGQPAFTWPFQDPRQRFQNLKVEFPDVEPMGVWQVELVDTTGTVVGPPALFTLNADDPQQELYVRYARR